MHGHVLFTYSSDVFMCDRGRWNWSMVLWGFVMVEESFKAQYYVRCLLSFSVLSFVLFSLFWPFLHKEACLAASCPLGVRL